MQSFDLVIYPLIVIHNHRFVNQNQCTLLETLEIPSIPFDEEVLFPNPKTAGPMDVVFLEGSKELEEMDHLEECKEKIKDALGMCTAPI